MTRPSIAWPCHIYFDFGLGGGAGGSTLFGTGILIVALGIALSRAMIVFFSISSPSTH